MQKNESKSDVTEPETQTFNVSDLLDTQANAPQTLAESKVVDLENDETVSVDNVQDFWDDLTKGKATTIKVGGDFIIADAKGAARISNMRDITLESADGKKHTIDFGGSTLTFTGGTVSFDNLNLYGKNYFGLFKNAKVYNFKDTDYTGSQAVYTNQDDAEINFTGTNNIKSVPEYTVRDIDGIEVKNAKNNTVTVTTQGLKHKGDQQVVELTATNGHVNVLNGTTTMTTTDSDVIRFGGASTGGYGNQSQVNVSAGATLNLNPHTLTGGEGVSYSSAIFADKSGSKDNQINVNGTLNINLEKTGTDKKMSAGIKLGSGSVINVNQGGNLNITQTGALESGIAPVILDGGGDINVTGGDFTVNGTNLGDSTGALIDVKGAGTVAIKKDGNFKVTGDGSSATALSMAKGSNVTSDQPGSFIVEMPEGASAVSNGTITLDNVKTDTSKDLGSVEITYENSNITDYTIKSTDHDSAVSVGKALTDHKNKLDFTKAPKQDVVLSNLHLEGNILTGTVSSDGDSTSPIYVAVKVGDKIVNATTNPNLTITTNKFGEVTDDKPEYSNLELASSGNNFSIDLTDALKDDGDKALPETTNITVTAYKDTAESAQTDTIKNLRNVNKTALKELVDDAPNVENGSLFTDASQTKQDAYKNAIADGQKVLDNTAATQTQVNEAIEKIKSAKTGLAIADTTDLEAEVKVANETTKPSDNYTNASDEQKTAFDNALATAEKLIKGQHTDGSAATADNPITKDEIDGAKQKLVDATASLTNTAIMQSLMPTQLRILTTTIRLVPTRRRL